MPLWLVGLNPDIKKRRRQRGALRDGRVESEHGAEIPEVQ